MPKKSLASRLNAHSLSVYEVRLITRPIIRSFITCEEGEGAILFRVPLLAGAVNTNVGSGLASMGQSIFVG